MTIALALDIAKHRTGWAVGGPDWPRPFWGAHILATPWDRHEGEALHAWRELLAHIIDLHSVTFVAVEQFFINMKDFDFNGTVPIAQMHGIVLELCAERKIRIAQVPIPAWRKRFLGLAAPPKEVQGKGKTDFWKRKAIEACTARDWYVTYHDEAEAIGILDFTLAALDPDYGHRTAPIVRRTELRADIQAFRGEAA